MSTSESIKRLYKKCNPSHLMLTSQHADALFCEALPKLVLGSDFPTPEPERRQAFPPTYKIAGMDSMSLLVQLDIRTEWEAGPLPLCRLL